jgi:hypothetical protein
MSDEKIRELIFGLELSRTQQKAMLDIAAVAELAEIQRDALWANQIELKNVPDVGQYRQISCRNIAGCIIFAVATGISWTSGSFLWSFLFGFAAVVFFFWSSYTSAVKSNIYILTNSHLFFIQKSMLSNGVIGYNLDQISCFRIRPQELHIYSDTPKPQIFLLRDEDIITISNYLLALRPDDIINVDK